MSGYRPIAELPDEDQRDVVFWNPCQGPYHEPLILAVEAEAFRTDGCFSHFLLLPAATERMREEHDQMMQDFHESIHVSAVKF